MNYSCAAITGASSGIGREIALKFARENVSVAIFARRLEKLKKVAEEINIINPDVKVFPFEGDIKNKESIEKFLEQCEANIGELDIFVNNAGIAFPDFFTDLKEDQVQDIVDTNFTGSVWSIYHVMRLFEKRKRGVLVNISSTTVLKQSSSLPLYAATKLGITGLVRSMEEKHLNNKNIKVINVIPGPTLTDLIPDTFDNVNADNMISPEDVAHWAWMAITSPKGCKVSNLVLRNTGKF